MGSKIDMEPNIWQRFVKYAADIFNRSRIVADGVTPYTRVNGREANSFVAVCCKTVFYHSTKQDMLKNEKIESPWAEGIHLGCLWMSNEYHRHTSRGDQCTFNREDARRRVLR